MRRLPFLGKTNRLRLSSTIFEAVLYIGLFVIIIASLMSFFVNLLNREAKIKTIIEVERNASFAAEKITSLIRSATEATVPADGATGSQLSLDMYDPAVSPTVFAVAGGVLTMRQGTGSVLPLTSNRVVVTNFSVTNLISESEHLRTETQVVPCQGNQNKRLICHGGNTQCVSKNAHWAEGDSLGPCYSITTAKPSIRLALTIISSADAGASNDYRSEQIIYASASIPRQN